ncbi:AfsR/SARP family transcriptional regulator [Amycolatopsis solani]|uniref:AfsR/SARP family transcriptional regulator n=1 Tax=Amycolatopsis solani TaxID=3028615 RepID=UPI00296FA3E5|nr:BTAD domain-containing putative transcriptional regulator [Amycolatopsis sp. MEP2-6]
MLGPLEVRDRGAVVAVGPPRIRAVCAILLVRPGDLVPVEQFVDELWPHRPPPDARALVRGYVSRLRRALRSGPSGADRVVTRKPGYLLRVEEEELDLHRFDRLVTAARTATRGGEPGRGAELFRCGHRLWRGEPFADVPRTGAVDAAATWLTEWRRGTLEERFEAALVAGRDADVRTELAEFVAANPLRERPAGQLMLALYRCGRRADALSHYRRIHRALADELGVEPGAELRELHRRILDGDPCLRATVTASARAPRQLPRDTGTLVGRDAELAALRATLQARGPVVVVHGAPGAGKSALAVRAARRLAAAFPDGQLYVDLAGPAPLPVEEALHRLLRGLGVAQVPPDPGEAVALFRTVAADRRLLVLLDNAVTAAQVRPLLPGGPGSAVLVTSRSRLAALDGATQQPLGGLSPDAAVAMLADLVAGNRVPVDPRAARSVAALCDHLPLALRAAAARLNARPGWTVRCLLSRLGDERHRLTELTVGDLGPRASYRAGYAVLSGSDDPADRAAARALCVFGSLPAAELDLDDAAAALGLSPAGTERVVERLLDAHWVEERTPGRFTVPGLVRLFAREQGRAVLPPGERLRERAARRPGPAPDRRTA